MVPWQGCASRLRGDELTAEVDISANRKAQKWTLREQAARLLWGLCHGLFAWSPRPMWAWRVSLLRAFGAKVGRDVRIHPTARITIPWNLTIGDHVGIGDAAILYALGPITIRSNATVSQYAHLCAGTHNFRDPQMTLERPPIAIGDGAWICADAFIGPGVTVGEMAVVGARSVVMQDVPSTAIVAGNPARVVGQR